MQYQKGFESNEIIGTHIKDFFPKYIYIKTLDPALDHIHSYIQKTEIHLAKNFGNMIQVKIQEFQDELRKAYKELEKLKDVIHKIVDLYPDFPRDQLKLRESKISNFMHRISDLNWTSISIISVLKVRYV